MNPRAFAGELGYKDRHGRVWRFSQKGSNWLAETLDVGHTNSPQKHDYNLLQLLGSIDREEYVIGKSSQPLETGAGRGQSISSSGESGVEAAGEFSEHTEPPSGNNSESSDEKRGSEGRDE